MKRGEISVAAAAREAGVGTGTFTPKKKRKVYTEAYLEELLKESPCPTCGRWTPIWSSSEKKRRRARPGASHGIMVRFRAPRTALSPPPALASSAGRTSSRSAWTLASAERAAVLLRTASDDQRAASAVARNVEKGEGQGSRQPRSTRNEVAKVSAKDTRSPFSRIARRISHVSCLETFETYCRERWGFSRQRGHQLIEAAQVAGSLSTTVDTPNERQARELVPLLDEPEKL